MTNTIIGRKQIEPDIDNCCRFNDKILESNAVHHKCTW